MGMSIDKTIEFFNGLECHTPQAKDARDMAIDTMRKYQQLKADYETRLKADMVAILEDLRLDFQEAELAGVLDNKELIFADEADGLIQQKIKALKGESDNEDNN